MAKLVETFRTPEARVQKAIVAVDLTESTKMKEIEPEANWLNTYGWFFDLLTDTISKHNGRIVKYLGDGVMAVFPEDNATDSVNWAIVVQEEMASARAKNLVNCHCTIGIAFGEAVEFDSAMGGQDYIGSVVDRAFRLSSAANANAIFADTNTVAAASMTKVTSKAGRSVAQKRTAAEYQGPEESIRLKGFSSPVAYCEILWENARFSVKPKVATELSARPGKFVGPRTPKPEEGAVPKQQVDSPWLKGEVYRFGDRFGFIKGPDQEEFWFNKDSLFTSGLTIRVGTEVWFIPGDPLAAGKNRIATDVIPFSATLKGKLAHVHPGGFGFALCRSDSGHEHSIFINLGDSSRWNAGTTVTFEVGENPKGIAGFRPIQDQ